ncbi:MAG: hypothetical protein O7D86_08775 [Proteobacteria bacterium]|nr:hypothetical protein [Pseudomonadota bacterium]
MSNNLSMRDDDQTAAEKKLAAKNMRLVIILGLVAFGFYIGFMLFYM